MATVYVDHVGNPLDQGHRVVLLPGERVGRIVSIDRYRDRPLQVQLHARNGQGPALYAYQWRAGETLLRVPDPPLVPAPAGAA